MSPPQDTRVDGAQSPDQDPLGQTSVADKGSFGQTPSNVCNKPRLSYITGVVVDTLK